jgi:HSP20 family molecular chaperone IbpA
MSSLKKSIDLDAPASLAFEQLIRYDEYPTFMEGVQEVRVTDRTHLHWRCISTQGVLREWDSEITAQIADQLIGWRNLNDHRNTGQVQLQALADGQTRVTLSMEYEAQCPPGHEQASEARTARRVEGDLQRFKTLVENKMSGAASVSADGAKVRDTTAPGKDAAPTWLPRLMEAWEEPLTAMRKMSHDMDGLFERFMSRPHGMASWTPSGHPGSWAPPVEVARRNNHLIISADLPGIKRDAVKVEIRNDELIIEGDWQPPAEAGNTEYRRTERTYGHFYRMIPLPHGVDPNSATASMLDGVLEITVPVTARQRQGRRLDIQSNKGT